MGPVSRLCLPVKAPKRPTMSHQEDMQWTAPQRPPSPPGPAHPAPTLHSAAPPPTLMWWPGFCRSFFDTTPTRVGSLGPATTGIPLKVVSSCGKGGGANASAHSSGRGGVLVGSWRRWRQRRGQGGAAPVAQLVSRSCRRPLVHPPPPTPTPPTHTPSHLGGVRDVGIRVHTHNLLLQPVNEAPEGLSGAAGAQPGSTHSPWAATHKPCAWQTAHHSTPSHCALWPLLRQPTP